MDSWKYDKNVLKHKHTKFWQYRLIDVDEPNLHKDIFPYDEVSRVDFDHKMLPINPAEEMFITDTTFRDGQQARPPYTVQQIVEVFKLLSGWADPTASSASPSFSYTARRTGRPSTKCLELGLPLSRRSRAGSGPPRRISSWSRTRA